MGEEQLLELASEFLKTPKGKKLLGEEINIDEITNRISFLSKKYDINLDTLLFPDDEEETDKDLSREERRAARRQERRDKRQQRKEDREARRKRRKAEIKSLQDQLKSEIPINETFTINGRLFDKITGDVLKGAKVQLGVNTETKIEVENPLNLDNKLINNLPDFNISNAVYIPIGTPTKTDKNGYYSLKANIPIIPKNQKTPLNLALLFSKSGFLPSTTPIINGDKTIKSNLSATSLTNIKEASEKISEEYNEIIDNSQELVAAIGLEIFDKVLSARKIQINKLVDTIKTKLIPLAVGLLIAFGISKLTEKNRKTCPSKAELDNVVRQRNRVVRQLNQIYLTIITNTALPGAFVALANSLKGVRLTMDNLPAPQAVGIPPAKDFGGLIFSQPYSFTAKIQDLNDKLEKFEEQNKEMTRATLVALVFLIAGAATVILLLKTIDSMTQECIEESGEWVLTSGNGENGPPLTPPPTPESPYTDSDGNVWAWDNNSNIELELINQELLDLSEEQTDDGNPVINNINGFVLSVETDNKNLVGTLKRRFAVAKDSRGITLLKGNPSFSSSDQILIDELVFYIQQNNLKAN